MTGIIAWHGEIVVVVDLAAYLFGKTAATQTMMVIAQHGAINIALAVTAIQTTVTLENKTSRDGEEWEALVLDTGALVAEIIQQIGMFSPHA
jgi:chemotaxis signal transduction protein